MGVGIMARTHQDNRCGPVELAMPLDAAAWSLKAVEPTLLSGWMDNGVRGLLRHLESCKMDFETHLRQEAGQVFQNGAQLQGMGSSIARSQQLHDDFFTLQPQEACIPSNSLLLSSSPISSTVTDVDDGYASPPSDACERMMRQMNRRDGSRRALTISSRGLDNVVGMTEAVLAEPLVASSSRHDVNRVSSDLEIARECLSSLGTQVMSQLTSSLPSTLGSRQSGAVLMTLAPSEQQLSASIGSLARPMPSLQVLPRFSEPQGSVPAPRAVKGNERPTEGEAERRKAKTGSAANGGFKLRLGRSGKRLVSGAIAGGVSRTGTTEWRLLHRYH